MRMDAILRCSFLAAAALLSGCASTPRPQPLVHSTPADKNSTVADSSGSTVAVDKATETSSSTSLSSRFTKLFSRQDSSDRMPLPRNDHPTPGGSGSDSAHADLASDF